MKRQRAGQRRSCDNNKENMKTYEVYDQRAPKKRPDGWDANLVYVGRLEAVDGERALLLAKRMARFPVVYNPDDFRSALAEEKAARAMEEA